MLIILGSSHSSKIIATANKQLKCSHCNNIVFLNFIKYFDWCTLYWIPLFSMHTEYRIECPICSYGLKIETKMAKEKISELKKNNNR